MSTETTTSCDWCWESIPSWASHLEIVYQGSTPPTQRAAGPLHACEDCANALLQFGKIRKKAS